MKKTPFTVIALAILGILWSLYLLVSSGKAALSLIIFFNHRPGFFSDLFAQKPFSLCKIIFPVPLQLVLATLLLLGSIGSFTLVPWARRLLFIWASCVLLWSTYHLVVELPFELKQLPIASPGSNPADFTLGYVTATCIHSFLPLCILIFFSLPHVRLAFASNSPPTSFPAIMPNNPPQY